MAYDREKHKNRVALRADLTLFLTHLTRAKSYLDDNWQGVQKTALDVLMEILESGSILGSDAFVVGDTKAACFQDTPIYSLGQMFYQEKQFREEAAHKAGKEPLPPEQNTDYRYTLYGISFTREYIWKKGGRPVFYEKSEEAKNMLAKDQWWRIVDLDWSHPTDGLVDWTHEREWRVPGSCFSFDLGEAMVILPNWSAVRKFREHEKEEQHGFSSKVRCILPVSPVLL